MQGGMLNACTVLVTLVLSLMSISQCEFYPGHLEQLAIACPNLEQLNLRLLKIVFTVCKDYVPLLIIWPLEWRVRNMPRLVSASTNY